MSPRKWRGLNPLEKDERAECDAMMRQLNWKVVRMGQRAGRGMNRTSRVSKGIPDRKYYRDRDTFWFEGKTIAGKQSDDQKKFQSMCEAAGEFYVLGGLNELTKFLQSWKSRTKRSA